MWETVVGKSRQVDLWSSQRSIFKRPGLFQKVWFESHWRWFELIRNRLATFMRRLLCNTVIGKQLPRFGYRKTRFASKVVSNRPHPYGIAFPRQETCVSSNWEVFEWYLKVPIPFVFPYSNRILGQNDFQSATVIFVNVPPHNIRHSNNWVLWCFSLLIIFRYHQIGISRVSIFCASCFIMQAKRVRICLSFSRQQYCNFCQLLCGPHTAPDIG